MDNQFILTDDMLWDYADGLLNQEERLRLEVYLQQNPAQQSRLNAVLNEKRAYSNLQLEVPNAGFSKQVLTAWAAEQLPQKAIKSAKTKGIDWILWSLAAGFALLLALPFLVSGLITTPTTPLEIPVDLISRVQVPYFDWVGFFTSPALRNGLLLAVAFMSLKLLDKYLQVRNIRLS